MKTEWDYSNLAKSYLKRPDYSDDAIDRMLEISGIGSASEICDIGAGVAHLTLKLVKRWMAVTAVEPNSEMRRLGMERTKGFENVKWCEGTGEATGQASSIFDMVTFGSSFNVTNRQLSLKESKRILKSDGWFAAMWNHRDLNDPIQKEIENIVKAAIPDYDYGIRREDQSVMLKSCGLFKEVIKIEGAILHLQSVKDVIEAWGSHATLHRQAKEKFFGIINDIERFLLNTNLNEISIPYTTRIWLAQLS